jgi:4-hydroxybenzoate polyprenyltransferase
MADTVTTQAGRAGSALTRAARGTADYLGNFGRLIKFEHSIFALPFAYAGAFLAAGEVPGFWRMFWITVAMVSARSLGMSLNRLIDARIDAMNPRTAGREIPSGVLSRVQVWFFALLSLAVLVVATFNLPVITRYLWPLVVIPMVIYPYLKRWTWLCHVVLGLVDGLGPIGAWVAVTGKVTWQPFVLGLGVGLWIAGFDIIYAFMDIGIDRAQKLHSIPADLGERAALWTTRGFHLVAVALLAYTGYLVNTGVLYFAGVAVCALLLFYENWMMRKADLAKIGVAFMTMNGIISVVYLFFTTISLYFWSGA